MRSTGFSGIVIRKYNIPQICLLSFALLSVQPSLFAVDDSAGYKAAFSPAQITIGDRVSYTITVRHEPGETVAFAWPDSIRLLPFVLIEEDVRQPQKNTTELSAELALIDIGRYALPSVTVTVIAGSGKMIKLSPSAPGFVMVKALTDSSITELRPLKPLKQPYRSWTEYLYPLVGGIMLIAVIVFAWYVVRKRYASFPVSVDPSRDALRNVRKLEKNLEKGVLPEKCYEQLSFLIREYLEKKHRIKALEAVTSEIEEELLRGSVPEAALFTEVLHKADLVKFAESRPGKEECLESLEKTKKAIGATK